MKLCSGRQLLDFHFSIFFQISNEKVPVFIIFFVQNKVTERIPLDPAVNKTGHIWHIFLQGEFHNMLYGYTFGGPFSPKDGHYFDSSLVLLDPYAKVYNTTHFNLLGHHNN